MPTANTNRAARTSEQDSPRGRYITPFEAFERAYAGADDLLLSPAGRRIVQGRRNFKAPTWFMGAIGHAETHPDTTSFDARVGDTDLRLIFAGEDEYLISPHDGMLTSVTTRGFLIAHKPDEGDLEGLVLLVAPKAVVAW